MDKSKLLSTSCLTAVLVCAMPGLVLANPINGVVSAGSATITSTGNTLNVNQTSSKAVIDWRGFDIAPSETTNFNQPSSSAIALNRVNSNSASHIEGNLNANGNVIIVNQNGVMFGKGAKVDVNGLIATTADFDSTKFMNDTTGKLTFDKASGNTTASIVNNGTITAKQAGLLGFVAPNVVNNGVITAKLGKVQLASGDTMTVDMYGDKLMEVAVSDQVKSQLVANTGLIEADGGRIALTAAAGSNIVNSLISVQGDLKAPAVAQKNGEIFIYAEGSNAVKGNITANKGKKAGGSNVLVSGALDVSGRKAGEHGGKVTVSGDNVALLNGTVIDASGSDGLSGTTKGLPKSAHRVGSAGGDIEIGGDYLGSGDVGTAKNLYVDSGALILNDSLNSGDAGRTIFWADNNTAFYGNVYARALGGRAIDQLTWNAVSGGNAGDGGFIETSGHGHLDAGGYVDLTASNGMRGTYFLDPTNISIYGNVDPTFISTDGTVNLGSSLQVWFDASQISGVSNGGSVHQLNDLSGNGNNAIAFGSDPVYLADGGNGMPAVHVTNSNGFLTQNPLGITGNSNRTESLIFNQTVAGNTNVLGFGVNGAGGINDILLYNSTIASHFYGGGFDTLGGAPAYSPGSVTSALLNYNGTQVSVYKDGVLGNTTAMNLNTQNSGLTIGSGTYSYYNGYTGNISEVAIYNSLLSAGATTVLNQYQAAKWGFALTPPGAGATEVAKATAADGYSAFTTRYLEHLSQSADISLQASNNINLDLKGDTLNFSTANRSLTLTAGNQITTTSAGNIATNGGNVTFNAANGIAFNNSLGITTNGGNLTFGNNVTLGAAQNWDAGSGTMGFNGTVNGANNLTAAAGHFNLTQPIGGTTPLGTVSITSANTINLPSIFASSINVTTTGGNISGAGGLITNGGPINLAADNDIDLTSMGVVSANGNVTLGGRDVYVNTAIDSGTGDFTVNASRDIYVTSNNLANGLVDYYKFNENGGLTAVDSAGGNNGTLTGGLGYSNSNPYNLAGNYSLNFDGSVNYATLPSNSNFAFGTGAFTVSVWYNAATTNYTPIFSIGGSNSSFGELGSNRLGSALFYYANGQQISSSAPTATGVWQLATLVGNGGADGSRNIKLYLNGVQTGNTYNFDYNFPQQAFVVGANQSAFSEVMNGKVDDVRVYNTALSAGDIAHLYAPQVTWQTSDTHLNSGRNLNFDLKGETLSASSLSLNSGQDIKTLSAGVLRANAGNILLAAGHDITNNYDFDLTATGSNSVTLRAGNSINYTGSGDITTNGGAITLNSDRDADHAGEISLGAGTVLASNGGDITLGGGTDPVTGYAYGTANSFFVEPDGATVNAGVHLSGATLNSGSGKITANGHGYTSGNVGLYGLDLDSGAQILSTSGNIALNGIGGSGTGYSYGIILDGYNSGTTLVKSGSGNITLTGLGGSGGDSNNGIRPYADAKITSTTGAITLKGTSGSSGYGIFSSTGTNLIGDGSYLGDITLVGNSLSLAGFDMQTSGRWLVYSTNPANNANIGLTADFNRYGCTYASGCATGVTVPGSGNGFVYSYTPTLTITPNSITALTYGDAAPSLSGYGYTISGYNTGEGTDTITGSLTGSTNYAAGSNIGNYYLNYASGSLLSSLGYGFSYANKTNAITVNARNITVAADAKTKTYGAADPSLTYQINSGSLYGFDALTGGLIRAAGESVASGPYAISQGTVSAGSNYHITYTGANLSINKAALTVTADNKSKTYGDANPGFTGVISGFISGENLANSGVSGSASYTTLADANSTVAGGPYAITAGLGSLAASNYSFNLVGGQLTVNSRALTVATDDKSKTYGAANPSYTGSNNLTAHDAALISWAYAPQSYAGNAGTYTIGATATDSGNRLANYTITNNYGSLVVNKAHLTVTADDKTRTYGDANPTLTGVISGFVSGENLGNSGVSGSAIYSTLADANSTVAGGPYAIMAGLGNLAASNYDFTLVNGQLTLTRRALIVTTDTKGKAYGDSDPAFTGSNNLTTNDAALISWAYAPQNYAGNAGTYTIGATATDASNRLANYTVTNNYGSLSVGKATLLVTANDKTMTYGGSNLPNFSDSITGYVNGENALTAGVTGDAALSTNATAYNGTAGSGSNAGSYTITASANNLAAANYNFTYRNGTLTVDKAHLTVAADNKSITLGNVEPVLTYNYSGLANGDSSANFSGSLAHDGGPAVGNYSITQNTLAAGGNYDISSFTPGVYTINGVVAPIPAAIIPNTVTYVIQNISQNVVTNSTFNTFNNLSQPVNNDSPNVTESNTSSTSSSGSQEPDQKDNDKKESAKLKIEQLEKTPVKFLSIKPSLVKLFKLNKYHSV